MDTIEILFSIIIAMVVSLFILALITINLTFAPGDGSHTGYITEVGRQGLIWRTHYVKVVDSHFSTGSDGSYWYYGFDEDNQSLFNQASNYPKNSTVTIDYRCDFFVFTWQRSGNCIVLDLRNG
jgi:hypothetical protein